MEVEIYFDVICPWCYIGKRRMDQLLLLPRYEEVTVTWQPYQLYPGIPPGGLLREDFLRRKNPGVTDIAELRARVPDRIKSEADAEGLVFDFSSIEYMPNTKLAHRLVMGAEAYGLQFQLVEVLFRYYFMEGYDIGNSNVLLRAGLEAGMPARDSEYILLEGHPGVSLEERLENGVKIGISGVPCIVTKSNFMLPGVQTLDVLQNFMSRVIELSEK